MNIQKKIVNPKNVLSHIDEIKPYETDALAAYKQVPLMVVLPETVKEVSKILIHQANLKMDLAIADRLYQLYGIEKAPVECIPMNIQKIGNNSVATVPVLYDMISKNNLPNYSFKSGEIIVMASVGAGMNINALTYKMP